MNSLRLACTIVGLYAAVTAGSQFIRGRRSVADANGPYPLATLALVASVALPGTLQLFLPGLLPTFERDSARILSGEWWRLMTPLFVQDGGLLGFIFNLLGLILASRVAEQLWGSVLTIVLFFVGGLVGEGVGLVWQPIGAGNSIGNFSLAASAAVACLVPQAAPTVRVLACLSLGADVLLVIFEDIHGAAALTGGALALLLRISPVKSSSR
jgi:membrane associated rhomboid family serine protease